jgi:hypothetical protein
MSQPRSQAANILREALNDPNAQLRKITDGNDGEKFEVNTSQGERLFARVKPTNNSEGLPYLEADILKSVNSPYICRPIIVDRIRNHYVIVTPFIDGTSLENHLRQNGPLTGNELETLAKTLFDSVAALSAAGAIHFDIKPANIMVGADGSFRLVDFGAARFMKKMRTERIYPARKFIAPEVLKYLFEPTDIAVQRLTQMTDMYGVGGVLYTAASGHGLTEFFNASSDVLQKVPPPIRTLVPHLNPSLAAIIDQLLSKEPARRLQPNSARILLQNGQIETTKCPLFFLKTKPRGEHGQMMNAIAAQNDRAGVYWASGSIPKFPPKSIVHNLMWEVAWPEDGRDFSIDLLNQYQRGVFALCVPAQELENPLDAGILAKNLSLIENTIIWRNNVASHLPIFAVIAIDEALLNSTDANVVRDAYAAKNIDGVILRVCVPSRMSLDVRHLNSIKSFIEPWRNNGKTVLFDGDLSALPLVLHGVSGLIATTFPRLNILKSRQVPPSFSVRPDGMYVSNFLSIIRPDYVTILKGSPLGRNFTNCDCAYCAINFMKRNRLSRWDRPQRRQHFIAIIPNEIENIKTSNTSDFRRRIEVAQNEALRARPTRIDLYALRVWLEFL